MSTIAIPTVVEKSIGNQTITLESGKLAFQAHGSVTIKCGDAVVLATAVMSDRPRGDVDFLPLTVEFEERLYAAGKIPGSFFRREGRPGESAILACRLTDRSIRPLFAKTLHNELQVILTVLSADKENPPEVLGMIGASAALSISHIPFDGPVGSCRVAYIEESQEYIIHPTYEQIKNSQLNMVVSSTRDAILMVEAGSDEVSEEIILEGIRRAQEANNITIDLIEELISKVGKPKVEAPSDTDAAKTMEDQIKGKLNGRLSEILEQNALKAERVEALESLEQSIAEELAEEYSSDQISGGFKNVLKEAVRHRILDEGIRPDGRATEEIRPITSEAGVLPRTHGSGLFTRGQTQVLSIATLGPMTMRQILDTVGPDDTNTKQYMHHYNFAPYSTGEARRVGSPGRREIGHGALAERALQSVLPSQEDFPYTIRVVSEVLSSNGSTSMGSVCGSTLALMDAGVPIKAPVSGIAMGLITDETGKYAVLSDIQGIEDFLGDMDFKVAGTSNGVNALQMDVKIQGLTADILREALEQARQGRLHILDKMNEVLSTHRSELSPYAPKMIRLQIPVEKIGAVIGPRGAVIRGIIEETGCSVDVSDDGGVTIGSSDQAMLNLAISKVEALTRELVVGDIITGKVGRTTDFGAFIELLPGKDGLLRNESMIEGETEVDIGQEITVMIREIDHLGRINLSRKALFGEEEPPTQRPQRPAYNDRGRPRSGGGGGGRGGFNNRDRSGGARDGGGQGRPGGGSQDRRFQGDSSQPPRND